MIRKILFAVLIVSAQLVFAGDARQGLSSLLSKVDHFQADFAQTITSESGIIGSQAKGKVKLTRAGQFYWHTLSPLEQLIIINDDEVMIYDPDLVQVTKRKFDLVQDKFPAFLLTANDDVLMNDFIVEEISANTFKLTPKQSDHLLQSVTLVFAKQMIAELKFKDNLGQDIDIVFSKQEMKQSFPSDTFKFITPNNVDIVEL